MLVSLNAEIYELRLELLSTSNIPGPELQIQKGELDQKLSLRIWMVLGEGAVFVFILLLGFYAVRNTIAKELDLAEQQKNFLLSITHELKSPLAAVKLQLQTLKSRDLPTEKRNQIYDRALNDSQRLEKLVENLLLVNKIESGRLPLSMVKTNVSECVQTIANETFENEISNGLLNLDIEEDIQSDLDRMALESIVMNLVENGLKYGLGSTVHVSLKKSENQMFTLAVSDKGQGIPDNEKQKVFERFYRRGNEEVRQAKGTGIGLYLVKLLVTQHNGTIRVENNGGVGSRFVAEFPLK